MEEPFESQLKWSGKAKVFGVYGRGLREMAVDEGAECISSKILRVLVHKKTECEKC